jgi:DNA-binding GntR family transcriptional regulator
MPIKQGFRRIMQERRVVDSGRRPPSVLAAPPVYKRTKDHPTERFSPVTLSDEVFEALVKDILSGAVEPGARLDEPSICRKFGVSRTPIREALRRLSGTGLVDVAPRRGVTVAQIDIAQLNNMYEALAEFEGLCSRLSAVRMTALEKKRLEVVNVNRQKRIADGDKDFASLNDEFHEAIYQGAHNLSIASVARSFRQRLAPFRALQFVPGHTEYSFHEHDGIVAAIVTSDTECAYSLMRDHITGAGLQVIEHFTKSNASAAANHRAWNRGTA